MKIEQPELPRLIPAREVRRMLGGIARPTLNDLIAEGVMPEPEVQLTRNIALFDLDKVVAAVRKLMRTATARVRPVTLPLAPTTVSARRPSDPPPDPAATYPAAPNHQEDHLP